MDHIWSQILEIVGTRKQTIYGSIGLVNTLSCTSPSDCRIVISCLQRTLASNRSPPVLRYQSLATYQHLIWERLNTGHWAKVWHGWRELYGLISVARVQALAEICESDYNNDDALISDVIRLCDLGIMLGSPVLDGVLEEIAEYLSEKRNWLRKDLIRNKENKFPSKRKKLSPESTFDLASVTIKLPKCLNTIPSLDSPSLTTFLTECKIPQKAYVLRGCIWNWPCMNGETRWSCDRLKELAGSRTVPVELGNKYTDNSWTQQLLTVDKFVDTYMSKNCKDIGYLAQHQLLEQVPSLSRDISIPEYCYTGDSDKDPEINVWIGPGGTVSPAHTDSKHNLLSQIVGTKYVAIFYPEDNDKLYPNQSPMFNNTSTVDFDNPDLDSFPKLRDLQGYHTLLKEGDILYIPPNVWHYVKSLEQSFSVSFWWD